MKLCQFCRRIELCMREMISFVFRWISKILLFSWQNYSYSYFKQVPKYLATGLKRPSETNSPPAEASTQWLKYKSNTIPILMHQMCISTNEVSSVVLWLKKLEIRKIVKTVRVEQTKYCAMKLRQLRRRIELCMREITLRFEMNCCFYKLLIITICCHPKVINKNT
jgi:hypothetical protein